MKYIIFTLLLLFAAPGLAATTDNIKRVETYLNDLKTAKATFTQTAYDGSVATGTFYLNRPGRLRFEYDAPVEDFIVADGVFVYFYDAELKEQSHTLIRNSLADFFLRKNLSFSDDITVEQITHTDDDLFVTVVKTKDPDGGKLILNFQNNPLQLKGWSVIDAQNLVTDIALSDIETDVKFSWGLFTFVDPNRSEPQYN